MNSRTRINKCIIHLPGKGEHQGHKWGLDQPTYADQPRDPPTPFALIVLRDASCSLLAMCQRDPRDSSPKCSQHSFVCVIKGSTSIVLLLVPSCSLAFCASTSFLQNKALTSPMLVLYMCPRCQKMDVSRDASWGTIC
jgi:hypothetical protein